MIEPGLDLREYLRSRRQLVDAALHRYLPVPPACPALMSEAMAYSVLAGGKRLRPILTLAAADAVAAHADTEPLPAAATRLSEVVDLAMPAACAVEMIHTYSLIHDDLPAMDNDSLRRGRPTAHVVFGDGMAILAGDALQAEAFALLVREPPFDDSVWARRKLSLVRLIAEAAGASGMVGGQVLDLQAAGQVKPGTAGPPARLDADGLRRMHAHKTGALIRAAAVAGAVVAGGTPELLSAIDGFAGALGLALQIVDDILDVEGVAEEIGKTAGKDAAAGKPTYPALFGLDESRRLAARAVEDAVAALRAAALEDSRLREIAEWSISRTR